MAFPVVPARVIVVVVAALLTAGCFMSPHRGERLGVEPEDPMGEQPGGTRTGSDDDAGSAEAGEPGDDAEGGADLMEVGSGSEPDAGTEDAEGADGAADGACGGGDC